MAEIRLDRVTKRFGSTAAVDEMSITIPDAAFVVLLGPTGAGKTTTLRLIAGLERPDSGDILIDGSSVARLSPAERNVAMVFQQYSLYPHLTVRENLAFPLKSPMLKTPPEQMPVFGTMASRFNDDGVTALYQALLPRLAALGLKLGKGKLPKVATRHSTHQVAIVPGARVRYLADIADTVRAYKLHAIEQSRLARELQQLHASAEMLRADDATKDGARSTVLRLAEGREARFDARAKRLLAMEIVAR